MGRHGLRGRCLALLLLLIGICGPAGAGQTLSGTVRRVADGDSYYVDVGRPAWLELRLRGVDCPESAWPGHWTAQPYSTRAKEFAASRLVGRTVQLRLDDEEDRYGRRIGDVFVDGEAMSHQLLHAGLAWWNPRYAPGDARLRGLQDEARAARRGLWADPKPVPPWIHRQKSR